MQANEDRSCPDGYKKCSPKTRNWFDIVCVKEDEVSEEVCPILKTRFYETSKIEELGPGWQSTVFLENLDLSIAWTKTESSSGPLEKTFVGIEPCSDIRQTRFFSLSRLYYPLELWAGFPECKFSYGGILARDFRYKKLLRYEISQFNLQRDSGVLKTLQSLP